MIKFLIQVSKSSTTVVETEVRDVLYAEDTSLAWSLKPGEHLYYILSPKSLQGDRMYSFAFYDSEELALKEAAKLIQHEAERTAHKSNLEVDQLKINDKISSIQVIKLK